MIEAIKRLINDAIIIIIIIMLSNAPWISRNIPSAKLPTFRADSISDTSLSMADRVLLPLRKPYCFGESDSSSFRSRLEVP